MKKIFGLFILAALLMSVAFGTVAFADEPEQSCSTVLSYTLWENYYTVSIPASTFESDDGGNLFAEFPVTISLYGDFTETVWLHAIKFTDALTLPEHVEGYDFSIPFTFLWFNGFEWLEASKSAEPTNFLEVTPTAQTGSTEFKVFVAKDDLDAKILLPDGEYSGYADFAFTTVNPFDK